MIPMPLIACVQPHPYLVQVNPWWVCSPVNSYSFYVELMGRNREENSRAKEVGKYSSGGFRRLSCAPPASA